MYSLFYIGYVTPKGKIFRFRAMPSMGSIAEASSTLDFLRTGPYRDNTLIVEVTPGGVEIAHRV